MRGIQLLRLARGAFRSKEQTWLGKSDGLSAITENLCSPAHFGLFPLTSPFAVVAKPHS